MDGQDCLREPQLVVVLVALQPALAAIDAIFNPLHFLLRYFSRIAK